MSWTHAKQESEKAWRKANPDKVRAIKRRWWANKKVKNLPVVPVLADKSPTVNDESGNVPEESRFGGEARESNMERRHPDPIGNLKPKHFGDSRGDRQPTSEGGEDPCSEPKRLKSGTSDAGETVPPVSPADVDDMMLAIQRDELIQSQLEEQPIFTTGEIILVKGALWRVKAVTEKRLYLDIYK